MHIEIRLYPATGGQGGRLAARRSELEATLGGRPGLRSFALAETREGIAMVAIADQPGAAADCHRRFEEWVAARLPDLGMHDALTVAGAVIARYET